MNSQDPYDIIVIGAGAGGLNIASFMNRIGLRVLMVDKSDRSIGGDCLNFGCVPSKALLHVSKIVSQAKEAEKFGIKSSGDLDWKAVATYIRDKVEFIREHENAQYFRDKGIEVVLGLASFASPESIEVDGTEYFGKKIVIATGSQPRMLSVPGIDEVKTVLNNENIFDMEDLPKNTLIVGGGPIGIEIAHALNGLGSKITVISNTEGILGREDAEVSQILFKHLKKKGIAFETNANLKSFSDPHTAVITQGEEKKEISFDAVFVAVGRIISVGSLNLDKAGVDTDERGKIVVNDYLGTTNPKVFVVGDVAGAHQFTHAAEVHAGVLLTNFFSPLKKKLNMDKMAWVTYTDPEVATFGLSERELTERGIEYTVQKTSFEDDDRAIVDDYQYSMSKLFISKKGTLLGGTMIAPNAGELIQELILANTLETPIKTLFKKVYPYPTATRANKKALSQYMAKSLTDFSAKVLRKLYR